MTTSINSTLQILNRDFSTFDTARQGDASKADGLISVNDLRQVADNVGGNYTPEQQQAAQFLLDNPAHLNFVDTASRIGKVDGLISRTGVDNATAQVESGDYLDTLLDTAASRRGDRLADGAYGDTDLSAALADPGLNPELRVLLQNRVSNEIREKLEGLENPDDWADPSYARQLNLETVSTAMEQLANGAAGMADPQAAATMIEDAWGEIQTAIDANYNGGASFENKAILEQTGRLAAIAQRAGNTELFQQLVGEARGNPALSAVTPGDYGTAQMTLDDRASMEGLPLYLELAKQEQANGADAPYALVEKIIGYNDSQIGELTKDYVEHTRELNWYIANLGQGASQADLETAVNNYVSTQSGEWRERYYDLQSQLAQRGEQLLGAAEQLRTTLPDADARALAETLFVSDEAQFAVRTALDQNPALVSEAPVAATRDWLAAAAGGGGSGAKASPEIARALGTAYLQRQVGNALEVGLNPSGTPDPQQLMTELEKLRQPGLARSLGLSETALNDALDQLAQINTDIANGQARTPDELRTLLSDNIDFDSEAFAADTPTGQVFRGLASTVATVSFAKATQMAIDDPSFLNVVNAAVQGADVSQQVLQLGVGVDLARTDSALGRFAGNEALGKLIGSVGVALDAVGAVQAFEQGDTLQGALQTVSALGGATAILGAGTTAGPVGAIVAGVAALASLGVSAYREKQEADKYQTDDAKRFLEDIGYDGDTARILSDTSGEGLSPMPLLQHYAAELGLTPQQARDFINYLGTEYDGAHLETMLPNLHRVLDDVDGDLTRVQDSAWYDDMRGYFGTQAQVWAAQNGVTLGG